MSMCDFAFAGSSQTETDVYYYYYYILPLRFHVIILGMPNRRVSDRTRDRNALKTERICRMHCDNGAAPSAKLAVQIMGLSDGRCTWIAFAVWFWLTWFWWLISLHALKKLHWNRQLTIYIRDNGQATVKCWIRRFYLAVGLASSRSRLIGWRAVAANAVGWVWRLATQWHFIMF